jgi:hypothetical protein
MALDVYFKEDILNALRAVYVAQQPGPEGSRALLAVGLAFGVIQPPSRGELPEQTIRQLIAPEKR